MLRSAQSYGISSTSTLDRSAIQESESDNPDAVEIDIKETIIQGSFLPVTVLALAGKFPTDSYVIDPNQGAKLVHYIGTFGNVKTLKTFM